MEQTEKIEFEDGQWWTIKAVVTRGMRKRLNQTTVKMMKVTNDNGDGYQFEPSVESFDPEALNDIMLRDSTVGWSFDLPVTNDNIDDMPEQYTTSVLERLNDLYNGRTEIEQAELKKN